MTPIFWRYLLKSFFKIFFLSIFSFIAILLVTRLKEIASFMALASNMKSILFFVLYQIPFILPIAIPISCLIASSVLFQGLSKTHELTSLRSSGLSIYQIVTPILFASFFLSCISFYISAELTSYCRIRSKEMIYEQSSINPIVLLQRQNLLKIKNAFVDLKSNNNGKTAKDLIFITNNKANGRLNFLYAQKLELEKDQLIGKHITLISHLQSENADCFDTLVIENQKKVATHANSLSQFMKRSRWNLSANYLPMKLLLNHLQTPSSSSTLRTTSILAEVIRRCTLAFCAFSFTFLGICFGIDISRNVSKKKILYAAFWALLILVSFVIGKSLKYYTFAASLIYLLPQPIILLIAQRTLYKISRGIE